jgi:multidrug efflux pump subunit AcrB
MIGPVTASVLTTIIGFGTILFLGGVFGKFLYSIPVVVFLILSFSLIDAIFFVPAHVKNINPPKSIPRRIRWLEPLKNFYEKGLVNALKHRIVFISGYIVLFIAILIISILTMKFVLLDVKDFDYFNIIIEAPQGTPLSNTSEMVKDIEKIVEETVPVEILKAYTTQIGHHDTEFLTAGGGKYSNWALMMVSLISSKDRKIKCEEVMDNLKKNFREKGLYEKYKRIGIEFFGGLSAGKAIDISFITNEDKLRNKLEKEALSYLKTIEGVNEIDSSNVIGKDEVSLKLDYGELAKVGLTALDVAQTVRTAFDGTIVTSIRKQGEDIEYRVRIKDPEKFRTENILNLPITNQKGQMVNLYHLAELNENPGTAVIKHESGKRVVTITANVDKKKITSAEINNLLLKKFETIVTQTPGLRMKFSGEQEETMTSMIGFLMAIIIAIIAVYFILVIVFDSYFQPVLIMSVVPFAIIGVMLTLLAHGMPISMLALIGIIGLVGVVVNDTIVMISHLNKKIKKEGRKFEVIAEGAKERFRPVILTTLTTFAGLLPTAYGMGGDIPTMRPMVLVMAWGLVFATFITLGFTPLLYSVFEVKKTKKIINKRNNKRKF